MLTLTNITPRYKIDKDCIRKVSHYLVDFTITKKNKGEVLILSGQITYRGELDIFSIQGKIAYELKNISNGF